MSVRSGNSVQKLPEMVDIPDSLCGSKEPEAGIYLMVMCLTCEWKDIEMKSVPAIGIHSLLNDYQKYT